MIMDAILELEGVCKAFPGSNFALQDVSFILPCGSILGFVGENGAGKTTTIGCILNTLRPDSGVVRVFGREMTDGDGELREQIGVVYDGENFPGYLSACELARVLGGLYRQWDDTLFNVYLDRFALPLEQKIARYSKGMTMKLALAAALSHHPKLLLLDEATSGLDPIMREEMLDLFLEFVGDEDHAILLSSHITSDLEKIADHIVFIHEGRVLLAAPKDELLERYAVLRCKASQLERIDPADCLAVRRREMSVDVLVADGRSAARRYRDCVIDRATLDEMMLLLVKGERL